MPITVTWDTDTKVCLIIEFDSAWVWQELIDALEQATEKSKESEHQSVSFVFDLRNSTIFPRDATFKMKRQQITMPDSMQYAVVIGTGQFSHLFVNFLDSATYGTGAQVLQFESIDEARAMLCPT